MNCHFEKALATIIEAQAARARSGGAYASDFDPLSSGWAEQIRKEAAKFVFDEEPSLALLDFVGTALNSRPELAAGILPIGQKSSKNWPTNWPKSGAAMSLMG